MIMVQIFGKERLVVLNIFASPNIVVPTRLPQAHGLVLKAHCKRVVSKEMLKY